MLVSECYSKTLHTLQTMALMSKQFKEEFNAVCDDMSGMIQQTIDYLEQDRKRVEKRLKEIEESKRSEELNDE